MLTVIIDAALLAAAFGAGYWYRGRRIVAAGTTPSMGSGAGTISGGGA